MNIASKTEISIVAALSIMLACSGGGGGSDAGTCQGSCTVPNGPEIVSLSTNSDRLLENQPLVVTAVVTDPDGTEDIQGGSLGDGNGNVLGTFVPTNQDGTFSITLAWNLIPAALVAEGVTPIAIGLEARFVDADQHAAVRSLELDLDCTDSEAQYCGGSCTALADDPAHCGQCNNKIPAEAVCVGGAPVCPNPSLPVACEAACVASNTPNCGSCGNDCAAYALIDATDARCVHGSFKGPSEANFCGYESAGGNQPGTGAGLCANGTTCAALKVLYINSQGTGTYYGFACDELPPDNHMGGGFASYSVLCVP